MLTCYSLQGSKQCMMFLDQEWKANTLRAVSQCFQIFTRLTGNYNVIILVEMFLVDNGHDFFAISLNVQI